MILGCDGIFDKCTSTEVNQYVWEGVLEDRAQDVHEQCGFAVDKVLKASVAKKTMDNITVVFVAFEAFQHRAFGSAPTPIGQASSTGSSADLELEPSPGQELVPAVPKNPLIHPIFSKTNKADVLYVVDEEDMKNI